MVKKSVVFFLVAVMGLMATPVKSFADSDDGSSSASSSSSGSGVAIGAAVVGGLLLYFLVVKDHKKPRRKSEEEAYRTRPEFLDAEKELAERSIVFNRDQPVFAATASSAR
ncbi:MAG: hypothetical protein WCH05_09455 [Chlorobiaceae bacterium]